MSFNSNVKYTIVEETRKKYHLKPFIPVCNNSQTHQVEIITQYYKILPC